MNDRFAFLVEKYLDNSLEEKEKAEFEYYLGEPDCALYLKHAEAIEYLLVNELGPFLRELAMGEHPELRDDPKMEEIFRIIDKHSDIPNPELKGMVKMFHSNMLRRKKRVRFALFASIPVAAVLLIGLFLLLFPFKKETPQELFALYYRPYYFESYRSAESDEALYWRAVDYYQYGRYSSSAALCREITSDGSNIPEYFFLYGMNYMGMDSMERALVKFKKVKEHPEYLERGLLAPSHWYSSLCYLSLGNADSALVELHALRGAILWPANRYRREELTEKVERIVKRMEEGRRQKAEGRR